MLCGIIGISSFVILVYGSDQYWCSLIVCLFIKKHISLVLAGECNKQWSLPVAHLLPTVTSLCWVYYQPAAHFACSWLVLRLLCGLHSNFVYIYLCVRTYHVRNNYVTYIVAMRPYFSRLRQFRRLLCVAAMSILPQLRLWDGYREAEAM